ncbi:MAG: hypothetical protein J1F64_03670 [Oscillospiraceae bacterium]|nr:hypothetical protein [Oscillospiraceae bacterium]
MKKRIFLAAAVIGVAAETAAVIYTIHTRDKPAFGGELLILSLSLMAAYCITELRDMVRRGPKPCKRLTTRTKSGKAILNKEAFFEYEEETLLNEQSAFEPFGAVVDKLCRYEETELRN